MNESKQQPDGQNRGGKRRRRRRGKGGGSGGNQQQQQQPNQQQRSPQQQKQAQAQGGGKQRPSDNHRGQQQNRQGGKQKPQQTSGKMRVAEDLRKAERQRELNRPEPPFVHVEKRYAVVIFETIQAAKAELDSLTAKASEVDQLNIVIRAEGGMDDPELSAIPKAKLFAGAAWTLIHERRINDGWYDAPR